MASRLTGSVTAQSAAGGADTELVRLGVSVKVGLKASTSMASPFASLSFLILLAKLLRRFSWKT